MHKNLIQYLSNLPIVFILISDILMLSTREEKDMNAIAYGLETRNPFAYLLIFMILYPPIMIILMEIIEKIKNKLDK